MKLRNKKTGEIREDSDLGKMLSRYEMPSFDSIAELCEEWEDYKPAEPLIKDEKIRKAVRTWAEANNVSRVSCDSCVAHKKYLLRFSATELFNEPIIELYSESEESLWDNEHYTIAELCGEGE